MSRGWWIALLVGCNGDSGLDKVDGADGNADGDVDTDVDADTDVDTDADADTDTEPPDTFTSMSGQLVFDVELDGESSCHALIDLQGEPYTGPCPNCRFAFDVTYNITQEIGHCELRPDQTWTEDLFQKRPKLAFSERFGWLPPFQPAYEVLYDVLWFGTSLDFTAYGGDVMPGPYWYIVTHRDIETDPATYYYYSGPVGGAPATFDGATLSWDPTWQRADYFRYTDYLDRSCGTYTNNPYGIGPFAGTIVRENVHVAYPDEIDVWEVTANAGTTLSASVDTWVAATAFQPALTLTDDTGCVLAESYGSFPCTYDDPNAWYGSSTSCPAIQVTLPVTGTYRLVVSGWSSYSSGYYVTDGDYELSVVGAMPTLLADNAERIEGPLLQEQTESLLVLLNP